MPPKVRYSKEQIADIAYELVREQGKDALSARTLAARLGTSTAPIFTAFSSIEELHTEVAQRAQKLYAEYAAQVLEGVPEFKAAGLGYIKFAKDEPQLFKLLFMSSDAEQTHYFPAKYEYEPLVRGHVESYGYDSDRARRIYNHMAVYTHGIAVMYAHGQCVFTDEDVSRMLSEMFSALTKGDKV
jgi:AcrR family transcriptional regulator